MNRITDEIRLEKIEAGIRTAENGRRGCKCCGERIRKDEKYFVPCNVSGSYGRLIYINICQKCLDIIKQINL